MEEKRSGKTTRIIIYYAETNTMTGRRGRVDSIGDCRGAWKAPPERLQTPERCAHASNDLDRLHMGPIRPTDHQRVPDTPPGTMATPSDDVRMRPRSPHWRTRDMRLPHGSSTSPDGPKRLPTKTTRCIARTARRARRGGRLVGAGRACGRRRIGSPEKGGVRQWSLSRVHRTVRAFRLELDYTFTIRRTTRR